MGEKYSVELGSVPPPRHYGMAFVIPWTGKRGRAYLSGRQQRRAKRSFWALVTSTIHNNKKLKTGTTTESGCADLRKKKKTNVFSVVLFIVSGFAAVNWKEPAGIFWPCSAGPPSAGCSAPRPVGFWVSPDTERPQNFWAAWSACGHPHEKNLFLCGQVEFHVLFSLVLPLGTPKSLPLFCGRFVHS